MSERCKHDVWSADHCYSCEAEGDTFNRQTERLIRYLVERVQRLEERIARLEAR